MISSNKTIYGSKQALLKCDRIRLLGNRILMNHNNKFNLSNSPTTMYDDFSFQHQNELS